MPLLPGLRTLIEIAVADRRVGDTLIRQKARFTKLIHEQSADGVCRALILVKVSLHAAAGEGFGERLSGQGFHDYDVELVADNNTIVEASTGNILRIRDGESEADWRATAESYEQAVMLQGDFFELLRRYSPIDIEEMIIGHIQAADAMGRFA